MQVDLSQDYLAITNLEPVDYRSLRKTGNMDTTLTVKRRALSRKELFASGGVYTGADVVFLLFQATLPEGWTPKPADEITDADGSIYKVTEVAGGKRDSSNQYQTWRCTSRNLIIAEELRDTIDIEQPSITHTPYLAKQWPEDGGGKVLYRNLLCRVQLVTEDLVEERGIIGYKGTHAIIVARQLAFDGSWEENRIRWHKDALTDVYLEITGYSQPNEITQLPILHGELAI